MSNDGELEFCDVEVVIDCSLRIFVLGCVDSIYLALVPYWRTNDWRRCVTIWKAGLLAGTGSSFVSVLKLAAEGYNTFR